MIWHEGPRAGVTTKRGGFLFLAEYIFSITGYIYLIIASLLVYFVRSVLSVWRYVCFQNDSIYLVVPQVYYEQQLYDGIVNEVQ